MPESLESPLQALLAWRESKQAEAIEQAYQASWPNSRPHHNRRESLSPTTTAPSCRILREDRNVPRKPLCKSGNRPEADKVWILNLIASYDLKFFTYLKKLDRKRSLEMRLETAKAIFLALLDDKKIYPTREERIGDNGYKINERGISQALLLLTNCESIPMTKRFAPRTWKIPPWRSFALEFGVRTFSSATVRNFRRRR